MITCSPRSLAPDANSVEACGVRCADSTRLSCGTPKRAKVSLACRMVSQSDLLPIMTATRGFGSEEFIGVLCKTPLEFVVYRVHKGFRGQIGMVGTNEDGQILGHLATFNHVYAHL